MTNSQQVNKLSESHFASKINNLLWLFVKVISVILVLSILLVTITVAFTWAPDQPVSVLQTRWAPPPSAFLDVAGMKVHIRDEGPKDDPTPLIMIHGTSSSLHTWEGWTQELKKQKRVISFDLPGFGLTGPSPDNDYTIKNYVRFVKSILDKLNVQHCTLVGNSFGGLISCATALAMPERIQKLILVDSAGCPDNESSSVPIAFWVAGTPLVNQLAEITLPRSFIESSVKDVYGNPDKVTPEIVDRYFDLALREGNRHALVQMIEQSISDVLIDQMHKLKQPTLILWGGKDSLIPPDQAEQFHHEIAGSQVVMFEDLGHVPQEEDPIRTVISVKRFLGLR